MNTESMSLKEYKTYLDSTVAFMEMWQSCYYALLSNPEHAHKECEELHKLAGKHAKELKRACRQYLEENDANKFFW
jgi:hypothetical protein